MNQHVRWWRRLGVKLTALIALVTLTTIGAFSWLAVRSQERHILDSVVHFGALLSDTIRRSIDYQMLEDRRRDAYLVMEAIGQQPGIERVRMVNPLGRITFSTEPTEVGRTADRKVAECASCHVGPLPPKPCSTPSTSRIYDGPDGHRNLVVVTPVYNEQRCSTAACHAHPDDQRVLGLIDLEVSLEAIDASTAELSRTTMLLAVLAMLVLGAVVITFVRLQVVRPARAMVAAIQRVAGNDLEHRIPVESHDEFGVLATRFNAMTSSLAQARAELRQLMESLERQVEERTAALKQAQESLVQSEKLSSLGKLSASIAHEINNPLMGILTLAKLLLRELDGGPLSDAQRQAAIRQLGMVQRETERCSAIVRNLLDFARRKALTLKQVDVNLALEEALSVAGNQLLLQAVTLEKSLGAVPTIKADLGQLRQACLNLVINALEAMPKGGSLRVSSEYFPAEGQVRVSIADTGVGISPEHLSRIFDPFFTTKEKGTGLGLSVVYGIVERHGGKMEVESKPGQGTRMLMILPVVAPPELRAAS